MSAAPPVGSPDRPATPRRGRGRRLGRGLFALVFVGLPLLGMAGLAGLRAWSDRSEGGAHLIRNTGGFDPATRVDRRGHASVEVVATAGLLSVAAEWGAEVRTITDPAEARQLQADDEKDRLHPDPDNSAGIGWRWWSWAEAQAKPTPPGSGSPTDPSDALRLPRGDGPGHPLIYLAGTMADSLVPRDTVRAVAPFWAWMLPLLGPILWWSWCPPGRCWPRLTIRRTLVATAGAALLLALVARSSPVDHAVLTLREFGALIVYDPEVESGRPNPFFVVFDEAGPDHTIMITPARAARISHALGRLPDLQALAFRGVPGPASIETAMLPPGNLNLRDLRLDGSHADAATLARLVEFPNLTDLVIARSPRIDDASLAHLRRLTNLADLSLGQLPITDAGLEHLHDLPNLRRLNIGPQAHLDPDHPPPDRLSRAALQRLADSLPNLERLLCPDSTEIRPTRPKAGGVESGVTP